MNGCNDQYSTVFDLGSYMIDSTGVAANSHERSPFDLRVLTTKIKPSQGKSAGSHEEINQTEK